MRTAVFAAAAAVTTLVSASALAQVRVRGHVNFGEPQPPVVVHQPPPVVVQPQPVYVPPAQAVNVDIPVQQAQYVPGRGYGRRWQDPAFFSMRVRERLDEIEFQARRDVMRGRAAPGTGRMIRVQRMEVERDLAAASADGVIMPFERRRVMDQVRSLETFADSQRDAFRPYGGGPRWFR